MAISVGDRLPEATFKEKTSEGLREVKSEEIFAGRKVVLFAVPGAFTPTCDMNHLPGYLENRDAILAKGVDEIAVVAVNDVFVMAAWAKASGGEGKIRFLSDWNASFARWSKTMSSFAGQVSQPFLTISASSWPAPQPA